MNPEKTIASIKRIIKFFKKRSFLLGWLYVCCVVGFDTFSYFKYSDRSLILLLGIYFVWLLLTFSIIAGYIAKYNLWRKWSAFKVLLRSDRHILVVKETDIDNWILDKWIDDEMFKAYMPTVAQNLQETDAAVKAANEILQSLKDENRNKN